MMAMPTDSFSTRKRPLVCIFSLDTGVGASRAGTGGLWVRVCVAEAAVLPKICVSSLFQRTLLSHVSQSSVKFTVAV